MTEKKEIMTRFNYEPRTMDEALAMADRLAKSSLVPKDFQNNAGNILVAMQMGAELDLKPMQAIQNLCVVNGRPSVFGDLGKAILLAHGYKIEMPNLEDVKKTEKATVTIIRPDGQKFTQTFSSDDAKKAGLWGKNQVWTQYPARQLSWRAFWFCARDAAADLLKGIAGAEEILDYVDTTAREVSPEIIQPQRLPESKRPEAFEGNGKSVEPKSVPRVQEPPRKEPSKITPADIPLEAGQSEELREESVNPDEIALKQWKRKDGGTSHFTIMTPSGLVLTTKSDDMIKVLRESRGTNKTATLKYWFSTNNKTHELAEAIIA